MYRVVPINAFTDNYIWALVGDNQKCAIVDPGDANPVLAKIKQYDWQLTEILLTHHHADHIGGVATLLEAFPDCRVVGPGSSRFSKLCEPLAEGDRVTLIATNSEFQVLELFGHTRDHIGFVDDANAFVGDTLFSIGCGRLFEGTAQQLFDSLGKLKALPETTQIFCAHEYTLANLEFALAVEPENTGLVEYQSQVLDWLSKEQASIPTNIKREKALNPFLRLHEEKLRQRVQQKFKAQTALTPAKAFELLRKWKDTF